MAQAIYKISYFSIFIAITTIWILFRVFIGIKNKTIDWKRELQLTLVYICIVVVVRFTFFPFSKVDGNIQPLILDVTNMWPFRINWIPFVNLFDYPNTQDILINIIGNATMFIPLGIVWPIVFKELNTHKKVIAAGVGCSLLIEILQLPFFVRVSDVDDLILNSLGYVIGYGIYLLVKISQKRI